MREIQVGDVVQDDDGYEGRVAELLEVDGEPGARLDYSEFSADVPPEATTWPLSTLWLVS
jgi:hypothetical protein